jgi:hypothetical protein
MNKLPNFNDYAYFVYLGNNKTYGFRNYTDPSTGLECGYVTGFDKHGSPVYKEWVFDNDSRRQIRVGINEIDKEKKKAIDFLRNCPECFGSPNGRYVIGANGEQKQVLAYFKEINETADAEKALASRKISIDAQKKALELKGAELVEMASFVNVFNSDEGILMVKVLDFAHNRPADFLAIYDDPARKVKALLNKALHASVLSKDGQMIKWEGKVIGADFDDAVSNLMKDEKLKKAIELNLSKFGVA